MNRVLRFTFILWVILLPISANAEEEIYDPLEPLNRKIFWLNDKLDIYLFEPVASGYDYIMPDVAQRSVGNFFDNIRYPIFLVSDLVQFKFKQAGVHSGRFVINTTLGVLGLFDVAKHFGLEPEEEDFGIALGYHGTPSGPYLVLPLLGPSNFRDTFGLIVDSFLNPVYYIDPAEVTYGMRALEFVNIRADLLEAIKTGKDSSLDFYLFAQAVYYQRRSALIYDGEAPREGSHEGDTTEEESFNEYDDEEEIEITDEVK